MTPAAILSGLDLLAVAAAFLSAALFLRRTVARRMSYMWIDLLFVILFIAMGAEFFIAAVAASKIVLVTFEHLVWALAAAAALLVAICTISSGIGIPEATGGGEFPKTDNKLNYGKRLFETFMNAMPWSTFIADTEGRLVFVNENFSKLKGMPAKEIIGKRVEEWASPKVARAIGESERAVISAQTRKQLLLAMPIGDPSVLGVVNLFPLKGPKGEQFLGGIAFDADEKLKSQSMASMLASIVELSPDAIYGLDENLQIVSWNGGAQDLFGYLPEEIIGRNVSQLNLPKDAEELLECKVVLDSGHSILDHEGIRVAKDGTPKDVIISACKIPYTKNECIRYSAIARDITDIKQAEIHLRKLNEELRVRAEDLSRMKLTLEKVRDAALEASVVKSAFVANVSHELRTPLSGVLGLSELLLKNHVDPETREMIRIVYDSSLSLLTIINDILDLSKLEAGTMALDIKPFSPADLVRDCDALLSSAAHDNGIELRSVLDPRLPGLVYGDAGRVRQLLLNLLGNAIKFTQRGSVLVGAEVLSSDEQQVLLKFSVQDTGMGIAQEDRRLLFTPFTRVEKSTKGISGTGLGLAICKWLVELMGGEIGFESEVGKGSLFWFQVAFPLATERVASATVTVMETVVAGERELLSRHRILVVEDNPVLAELTIRQLSFLGAHADYVSDGMSAVNAVAERNSDIILLDIHLPDISGYEVAARIRKMRPVGMTPVIIAMTAGAMPGDKERALASGMNDYLPKPVSLALLSRVLFDWAKKIDLEQGETPPT